MCGQNVCIDYYYEVALDFWTQYMTARFGHSASQRQVDDPALKSIQILVYLTCTILQVNCSTSRQQF